MDLLVHEYPILQPRKCEDTEYTEDELQRIRMTQWRSKNILKYFNKSDVKKTKWNYIKVTLNQQNIIFH